MVSSLSAGEGDLQRWASTLANMSNALSGEEGELALASCLYHVQLCIFSALSAGETFFFIINNSLIYAVFK
jgi:hypothetical protein